MTIELKRLDCPYCGANIPKQEIFHHRFAVCKYCRATVLISQDGAEETEETEDEDFYDSYLWYMR